MSLLLIDTTKVAELARLYWESRRHPEDRARWECIGADAEEFLVGNMARFLDTLIAVSAAPASFVEQAEQRISAAVQTQVRLEPELTALLAGSPAAELLHPPGVPPCGARALMSQLRCTLPRHGDQRSHEQWVDGTLVATWRTT